MEGSCAFGSGAAGFAAPVADLIVGGLVEKISVIGGLAGGALFVLVVGEALLAIVAVLVAAGEVWPVGVAGRVCHQASLPFGSFEVLVLSSEDVPFCSGVMSELRRLFR
jgi:hypothetical protein